MPIMKWGTPPGGTHNDRKAHVVGHGEGVALVHEAFGTRVAGDAQQDTGNPNHDKATKWSTAPYTGDRVPDVEERNEPPNIWGYRSPKREKRCMGNGDTCNAWATNKYDGQYCNAHGRQSQGLPAWPNNDKPVEHVSAEDLWT